MTSIALGWQATIFFTVPSIEIPATHEVCPLYFVRSGDIWLDVDWEGDDDGVEHVRPTFQDVGNNGFYWSSRTHKSYSDYSYSLFYSAYVSPSNYGSRYNAFSLRCLSTVLDR